MEEKRPMETEHTIEENVLPDQPSENEMNEKYNSLIASGKEKMAKADYSGAKKDLSEAKEHETYGRGSPVDHRLR